MSDDEVIVRSICRQSFAKGYVIREEEDEEETADDGRNGSGSGSGFMESIFAFRTEHLSGGKDGIEYGTSNDGEDNGDAAGSWNPRRDRPTFKAGNVSNNRRGSIGSDFSDISEEDDKGSANGEWNPKGNRWAVRRGSSESDLSSGSFLATPPGRAGEIGRIGPVPLGKTSWATSRSGGAVPSSRVVGESLQGSFGGAFGESFMGSFSGSFGGSFLGETSSSGSGAGPSVEVGNLVFVTDAEMASIMKGGDSNYRRPAGLAKSLAPTAMLGTGAFSTVRLARRRRPDGTPATPCGSHRTDDGEELVAVKIIQKSILKQMKTLERGLGNRMNVVTAFDNIEREIATMKRLRHPNLVRLYDVIDSVESDRLHMVLEYVGLGEILSHVEGTDEYTRKRYRSRVKGLNSKGHFDEHHAALYFVDVLHGLACLHRQRICHRDLKPENILLCDTGIAKISDFGVAHIFEDDSVRESLMRKSTAYRQDSDNSSDCLGKSTLGKSRFLSEREVDCALGMPARPDSGMLNKTEGTYCFYSPEMCIADAGGFSGYAADLWAAGVCLYIFASGRLPFFSDDPSDLFDLIAEAEVPYDRHSPGFSSDLRDLLEGLLARDPAERAGVGDCLKHRFCADARERRLRELGERCGGEGGEHIIPSRDDVQRALSVSVGPLGQGGAGNVVSISSRRATIESELSDVGEEEDEDGEDKDGEDGGQDRRHVRWRSGAGGFVSSRRRSSSESDLPAPPKLGRAHTEGMRGPVGRQMTRQMAMRNVSGSSSPFWPINGGSLRSGFTARMSERWNSRLSINGRKK